MTPFDQLVQHEPPLRYGDCWRTCIASMLSQPPHNVPHFILKHCVDGMSLEQMHAEARSWLRLHRGVDLLTIDLRHLDETLWHHLPLGFCIASGESPRSSDVQHAVIWAWNADGGYMVHDPHPSRAGIVGRPVLLEYVIPMAGVPCA